MTEARALLGNYGIGTLRTEAEAANYFARQGGLHNLCYAINSFDQIHTIEYARAVHTRLHAARNLGTQVAAQRGLSPAQAALVERTFIEQEMSKMASQLERGFRFW